MSRRQNEGGGAKQNPATKYLKWASNNKTLSFYNKDTKENELVKLPYKFVILAERHAVGGWDDKNGCSIYSNEVKFIGKEPITVKSSKGGLIVSGIYKENKVRIIEAGGHYEKSVYVFNLGTKSIEKISFKGSATQAFGDFINEIKGKKLDYVINLVGSVDEKKGSVKYSKPKFELGEAIDENLDELVEKAYEEIEAYFGQPNIKEEQPDEYIEGVTDAEPIGVDSESDDLPF